LTGYYYVSPGSSSSESEGGDSSSSAYAANSETDDFTPLTPVLVDNGHIFAFAAVSFVRQEFDGYLKIIFLLAVCSLAIQSAEQLCR
jgi:hypothetical protein